MAVKLVLKKSLSFANDKVEYFLFWKGFLSEKLCQPIIFQTKLIIQIEF